MVGELEREERREVRLEVLALENLEGNFNFIFGSRRSPDGFTQGVT